MPDAPEAARESPEIDAFPLNANIWEVEEAKRTRDGVRPIASEHIDGLFGSESQFHRTHGFYIDVVDETTASFRRGGKAARSRCGRRSKVGPDRRGAIRRRPRRI